MAGEPRVWILSGGRRGDLDQMLALIHAVGWPCEVKDLRFRGPRHPLTARLETPLNPPWPDLAICAEALPSMVARRIRQWSSGSTRIVCLGRPAGSPRDFDLVITTAQYRIAPASNVLELAMPLTGEIADPLPPPPDGPIVLLVGGPAFPDLMNAGIARRLAADAMSYAAGRKRLLHVFTSPRTPQEAVATLERMIVAPHRLTVFGRGENLYLEALAGASEAVVTSDSVSMLSDVLAAARPVSVYRLPQAAGLKWRLGCWLYRHAVEQPQPWLRPVTWLFNTGVIEPAPDRQRLLARLAAEKRMSWFGGQTEPPDISATLRDRDSAARRLRMIMTR
jgi:mitochondrial fission protein ELM1